MLVLNFSYNANDFHEAVNGLAINNERHRVFDFTATLQGNSNFSVSYPSVIDSDHKHQKSALDEYIEQAGMLSRVRSKTKKTDVRDITVKGLPIYWLTDISEKHPQNSILKNLFYFKHLYDKITIDSEEILIVLPAKNLHYQQAILDFLAKKSITTKRISFNKKFHFQTSYYIFFHYLKNFTAKFREGKQIRKGHTANSPDFKNLIFTYFPQTWQSQSNSDYILGGIQKLCVEKKIDHRYFPLTYNLADLENISASQNFDAACIPALPRIAQIPGLFGSMLSAYRKISASDYDLSAFTFVDRTVLNYELNNVLHNKTDFFFNYLWIRNYFDRTDFAFNVFYQDEFYPPGRLISLAAAKSKNKKITTYGVQHGLFYEAHTVYRITDNELKETSKYNALPVPGHFITWGPVFSNLFLLYNSLNKNYVIDAGNLNYIYRRKTNENSGRASHRYDKKTILWCTTLKTDVIYTYTNILKEFVNTYKDVIIIVRCHPQIRLHDFIKEELIGSEFGVNYKFSEEADILNDIRKSDIVLTYSGSTVFLDALVEEKKVFHIVNNDYYMGDLGKQQMEHIHNASDMKKAYENFNNRKEVNEEIGALLTLDTGKWENIIQTVNFIHH